jgi:hypothetical protein
MTYPFRVVISESTAGTGCTYTFSLNNLYDPDKTGVGQQPVNFDQVCSLYTQFRVVRCDYDVQFCNATAYTPGAVLPSVTVGAVPTWNDALPTSPFTWIAQPRSCCKLLTPLGGSNIYRLRGSVRPWEVLSIPRRQYMDDTDYICSASGPTARNVYLNLFGVGNSAVATVWMTGTLTYYVQCMIPVLNTYS